MFGDSAPAMTYVQYSINDVFLKKRLDSHQTCMDRLLRLAKQTLKMLVTLISCQGLVGCFGFNGPLRQYFSLYRAVSQREGEREEKG